MPAEDAPTADGHTTTATFGSVTAANMTISSAHDGVFGDPAVEPVAPLALHPSAHVLHYGSACFEGLKAHRGTDGVVRLFRAGDHVRRMQASASAVCLPVPPSALLARMIRDAVVANLDEVPDPPGALYLRPVLIGTDANIGAAATPSRDALLYVLASPVGEYFTFGRTLTLRIETELPRSTPQFGSVKAGANYAMALGLTLKARAEDGADQVLFAPGGDVQETGASNVVLIDDDRLVTKALDRSFLHGVTRDSVLTIARDLGYDVVERDIDVDELLAWTERGEIALVGTAAVMADVGTLVADGLRYDVVASGGPNLRRLRGALVAVQRGEAPDRWGWTDAIDIG